MDVKTTAPLNGGAFFIDYRLFMRLPRLDFTSLRFIQNENFLDVFDRVFFLIIVKD